MRAKSLRLFLAAVLVATLMLPLIGAAGEKLKPEELIAKHLEAIGPAAARAAVETRAVEGLGQLTALTGGSGNMEGPARLVSAGRKFHLGIAFGNPDYQSEQLCFDGAKADAVTLQAGRRSPLGAFLYQNKHLLEEGLLGGVLSTAWPLLEVGERGPKLKYDGLRKVEGRELHRLEYRVRNAPGDVKQVKSAVAVEAHDDFS